MNERRLFVGVRLSQTEHAALVRIAGEHSLSEALRSLLHRATLFDSIESLLERTHESLAERILATSNVTGASEFRIALADVAQLLVYLTPDMGVKGAINAAVLKIRSGQQ